MNEFRNFVEMGVKKIVFLLFYDGFLVWEMKLFGDFLFVIF